ncbi:hypothetical protein J40TS1_53500 [Paenibacillus montaniterrae]|uniref:DUF6602 domain-containing protein n=1 Tax=Paenibacillus montaniterrae TaxID=429341 RepID=A0A919YTC8_9BACL|nr:DUF6602 domain-containing protein [Paenibacillus montaniterrae]GIP19708.1 hypothetical protein J40TS1_53500 [Paenibacillus montaniterrae]
MANNIKDSDKNIKLIKNIKHNYSQLERSIVEQLFMKHDLHGGTVGSAREDIWRQLFEVIIPKKFVIEQSVFIIDSTGNVSHEVDLAILDETYTPYIFRYGRLKFIPIEAVAVVIECKSQSINAERISGWQESIQNLQTAKESITRLAASVSFEAVATQQSTRPIRILCALKNQVIDEVQKDFDFVILADQINLDNEVKSTIKIEYKDQTLLEWFDSLNFHNLEYEKVCKSEEELSRSKAWREKLQDITLSKYMITDNKSTDQPISHSLLSFNFQFNQLLMLINNPILFPHRAYVAMFNGPEGEND